jgi:1-acyl-sn-glycerol-3-phosphate acyltransferase
MNPLALRCFLWFFTRLSYRVTVLRPDNVPPTGGALVVSNHVSLVDLLLILASTGRFVQFLLPLDWCRRRERGRFKGSKRKLRVR